MAVFVVIKLGVFDRKLGVSPDVFLAAKKVFLRRY